MGRLIFIGGGARSGKSAAAVARALAYPTPRGFIATAQAHDDEMRERIALHRAERAANFFTIEEPRALAEAIERCDNAAVVLIDCLTLWLSNLILDHASDEQIACATQQWLRAVAIHSGTVIVVANEVGQGIVPMDPLTRRFRDEAGRLNQRVAAAAQEVEVRFFGLGVTLKNEAISPSSTGAPA